MKALRATAKSSAKTNADTNKAMQFRKVFVTGADGFIGSHLVERLVARGYDVTAFVMYNSFNSIGWLQAIDERVRRSTRIIAGDLRDFDSVRSAAKGSESCMHLGALIAIPYSYRAPEAYLDTNIRGTLNVLRSATDLGFGRVIHTSTSEVYGSAQRVPIGEDHPLQGQSPYSASKIAADQLAYSYYCSFNLPVVTIRPFNTFGPRQSARAVIPTVISQLAKSSRVQLGATSPTRDFTYVSDTVDGLIAGLNAGERAVGEVINLGTGFDISVENTARLIAELMGKSIEIETQIERLRPEKSEVTRLQSSNQKARRLMGWEPRFGGIAGLRQGLEETIEWFLEPSNLSHYREGEYNV
jgi:NAD dependent epimerase/dehydratase